MDKKSQATPATSLSKWILLDWQLENQIEKLAKTIPPQSSESLRLALKSWAHLCLVQWDQLKLMGHRSHSNNLKWLVTTLANLTLGSTVQSTTYGTNVFQATQASFLESSPKICFPNHMLITLPRVSKRRSLVVQTCLLISALFRLAKRSSTTNISAWSSKAQIIVQRETIWNTWSQ